MPLRDINVNDMKELTSTLAGISKELHEFRKAFEKVSKLLIDTQKEKTYVIGERTNVFGTGGVGSNSGKEGIFSPVVPGPAAERSGEAEEPSDGDRTAGD